MMLGKKIDKALVGSEEWIALAEWCNNNNCYPADRGEYYEVIENDIVVEQLPVTEETTIADLEEAIAILTDIVLGGE